MAGRFAHADVPVKSKYNSGGGIAGLQSQQEADRQHYFILGLCGYCARAAAEGRPLLCPDCTEIFERTARSGQAN
jgi:hypothetical protein